MKHLLLASLITLLAIGTACGQASEPALEPVANDGIQVHGHWTVTVTNSDGTIDAVHEFNNSLDTSHGSALMTALLAGETTVDGSRWEFALTQPSSNYGGIADALACQESTTTITYATWIPAVATRNHLLTGVPLTLAGVCTVQTAETTVMISQVRSMMRLMPPGVDLLQPNTQIVGGYLTSHTLTDDIMAANDQSLSFNVVISFS